MLGQAKAMSPNNIAIDASLTKTAQQIFEETTNIPNTSIISTSADTPMITTPLTITLSGTSKLVGYRLFIEFLGSNTSNNLFSSNKIVSTDLIKYWGYIGGANSSGQLGIYPVNFNNESQTLSIYIPQSLLTNLFEDNTLYNNSQYKFYIQQFWEMNGTEINEDVYFLTQECYFRTKTSFVINNFTYYNNTTQEWVVFPNETIIDYPQSNIIMSANFSPTDVPLKYVKWEIKDYENNIVIKETYANTQEVRFEFDGMLEDQEYIVYLELGNIYNNIQNKQIRLKITYVAGLLYNGIANAKPNCSTGAIGVSWESIDITGSMYEKTVSGYQEITNPEARYFLKNVPNVGQTTLDLIKDRYVIWDNSNGVQGLSVPSDSVYIWNGRLPPDIFEGANTDNGWQPNVILAEWENDVSFFTLRVMKNIANEYQFVYVEGLSSGTGKTQTMDNIRDFVPIDHIGLDVWYSIACIPRDYLGRYHIEIVGTQNLTGGLLPRDDLYPDEFLYPQQEITESDGLSYPVDLYNLSPTALETYTNYIKVYGHQHIHYLLAMNYDLFNYFLGDASAPETNKFNDPNYNFSWNDIPTSTLNKEYKIYFVGKFEDNFQAGNSQELTGDLYAWVVYRQTEGSNFLEKLIYLSPQAQSFVDYKTGNNVKYKYYVYPVTQITNPITYATMEIYHIPLTTDFISVYFDSWLLYSMKPKSETTILNRDFDNGVEGAQDYSYIISKNTNVYTMTNIYKFRNNLSTSEMSNNSNDNVIKTFGKYPKAFQSLSRYRTGQLTSLLGYLVEDDNGGITMVDNIALEKQLDDLYADNNPKILKDRRGNVWSVSLSSPLSMRVEDKSVDQLLTVTVAWTEVQDISQIELINSAHQQKWLFTETGIPEDNVEYLLLFGYIMETPDVANRQILTESNLVLE